MIFCRLRAYCGSLFAGYTTDRHATTGALCCARHLPRQLSSAWTSARTCKQPFRALPTLTAGSQRPLHVDAAVSAVMLGSRTVRLGIDPDNSGALAVVSCSGLSEDGTLQKAMVEVHDMPVELHATGKRMRKQTNSRAISQLLQSILAERGPDQVCAFLEEPTPNALNGKQSWFGCGFAYGAWNGVLASHGIPVTTVCSRRWKSDLQLNTKGKAGSRELALQLFPEAESLLKRVKDHGRAEALLIAAWGIGVRIAKPAHVSAESADMLDSVSALPQLEAELLTSSASSVLTEDVLVRSLSTRTALAESQPALEKELSSVILSQPSKLTQSKLTQSTVNPEVPARRQRVHKLVAV